MEQVATQHPQRAGERARAWQYLLLVLLCLFAFLPGIASLPPTDRDESRYVQATKQMVDTADYLDISFQDESRYKKPIGIYWLQSLALQASGHGAEAPLWTYRLVSVVGGTLAVLTTAWLGARMFGAGAGMIAGIGMAGIFMLGFEARIAKTDATLLAAAVIAQAALAHVYLGYREQARISAAAPIVFWLAQGVAILIKGPVVLAVSALTVVSLLVMDRDRAWLNRMRPVIGPLLMVAVAAPWLILITIKSGADFWRESVGDDFIAKIGSGQESHGMPPGYYAAAFVLLTFPFAPLALAGGLKALTRFRESPALLFCLCWYIPFWVVLEFVPTKLPHYMLPVYPALMLAMAWGLTSPQAMSTVLTGWKLWLWRIALAGYLFVAVVLAAFVAGITPYLIGGVSLAGLAAAALVLVAAWLGTGLWLDLPAQRRILLAALSFMAALALVATSLLPSLNPVWLSRSIAQSVEQFRHCPDSRLIAVGYHEPSLVFLAGTDTMLLSPGPAAEAMGADPCALLAVDARNVEAVLAALADAGESLERVATIEGINYSRGQQLEMQLFRHRQAPGTQP